MMRFSFELLAAKALKNLRGSLSFLIQKGLYSFDLTDLAIF
jgi:hypothetical protein